MGPQSASSRRFITVIAAIAITLGTFSFGTIAPSPAAATSLTCAQGGSCVVGDRGPGGGLIFLVQDGIAYENGQTSTGNRENSGDAWCTSGSVVTGTAVGTGRANTEAMKEGCSSGISQKVSVLTLNAKSDWYLPSKDEMQALVDFLVVTGTANATLSPLGQDGLFDNFYWTSSQGTTFTLAWSNKQKSGESGETAKTGSLRWRAIRSFTNPLVTPTITWTPTTAYTLPTSTVSLTSVTTSSDGAINYSVTTGNEICSVNADTGALTYTGAGTCQITATVAATDTYLSASTTATIAIAAARAPGGGGSAGGGSAGAGSAGGGSAGGGADGNSDSGVGGGTGSTAGPRPSPPSANPQPVTFADAREVPPSQVSGLTPEQVASIPAAQFKDLPLGVFAVLTAAQVTNLPTELVRAIRPQRVASLQPEAVAGMSGEQLSSLQLPSVRAMSPEQIGAISPEVISTVEPAFLAQLKPKVLAAMDLAVIAALSPQQAAAIRPAALARLPIASLRQLYPDTFAALSVRQLRKLTPRQVSQLTGDQFDKLTRVQRQALRRS